MTVSAAPVSPATTSDLRQTGTTLTIEPGRTESTGTMMIAAENNTVHAPDNPPGAGGDGPLRQAGSILK